MLEALIYIAIGLFIGWNLPQPEWAKALEEKVMNWFKSS
jgi:hypothetical protein